MPAYFMTPEQLDADAALDPAIRPLPQTVDFAAEPNAIFLTGITGFVGAFLTRELLKTTEAVIYSLVRAETVERGAQRIRENLEQYNLWQDVYAARLIPVIGDLKLPKFGLTDEVFALLAETIDSIYHCGSKLSYVAPYEYLRAANVGGTQEALRLATTTTAKPFHYVSSLGILLAYKIPEGGQEDDPLDAGKCPDVGYFQTKYVAERVVHLARERGIPVTIHRIGLIVGDSETGVSNVDDFVARMLAGCIQVGYAPDIANSMDMTPVNYVAAAMAHLSRQPESVGKVFHLLNPAPIHWSDIFDMVIAEGYAVRKLPFNEWVEAVEENADPQTNVLYPLLPFFHITFARRMLGVENSHYYQLGTANTQAAMNGSGLTCPKIDRELIRTFLAQLIQTGRLSDTLTL